MRILVQEAPDSPSDLHVLEISARSVSLSWTLDFDGNSPISGYEGKISGATQRHFQSLVPTKLENLQFKD